MVHIHWKGAFFNVKVYAPFQVLNGTPCWIALLLTAKYAPLTASRSHATSISGTFCLMCSTNDEAFGAPSIKPIIPTRGIPKVILSRSSASSGSIMILVGGDKGIAKDAAFARSGKCE